MDKGINKFLTSLKKNFLDASESLILGKTETSELQKSQFALLESIQKGDIKGVKTYIEKVGNTLTTDYLIQSNLLYTTDKDKQDRVEILKLILDEHRKQKEPSFILCQTQIIEKREIEQFKLVSQRCDEFFNPIPYGIDKELERSAVDGDEEKFEAIISANLCKREWATPLFTAAYLGGSNKIAETLLKIGADPTRNGDHYLLQTFNDFLKSSPNQNNTKHIERIISFYNKEHIKSIPKDTRDGLLPSIKKLLDKRLEALNANKPQHKDPDIPSM
jgi:hypothetical protein